jgi:hypothetical protein
MLDGCTDERAARRNGVPVEGPDDYAALGGLMWHRGSSCGGAGWPMARLRLQGSRLRLGPANKLAGRLALGRIPTICFASNDIVQASRTIMFLGRLGKGVSFSLADEVFPVVFLTFHRDELVRALRSHGIRVEETEMLILLSQWCS